MKNNKSTERGLANNTPALQLSPDMTWVEPRSRNSQQFWTLPLQNYGRVFTLFVLQRDSSLTRQRPDTLAATHRQEQLRLWEHGRNKCAESSHITCCWRYQVGCKHKNQHLVWSGLFTTIPSPYNIVSGILITRSLPAII